MIIDKKFKTAKYRKFLCKRVRKDDYRFHYRHNLWFTSSKNNRIMAWYDCFYTRDRYLYNVPDISVFVYALFTQKKTAAYAEA